VRNLEFLIKLRDEIEHRPTTKIDTRIAAELQACCINFNNALSTLFGARHSLEQRLPIALQFVSFDVDQRGLLKTEHALPQHIQTFISAFEHKLTPEEYADPAYRLRIAFVPLAGNRASNSDRAVEFVRLGGKTPPAGSQVYIKEVNKPRYIAKQICKVMQDSGYPRFALQDHTKLWKQLDAKKPAKSFGCQGDYRNTWVWNESWVERVRKHCEESGERYK
jgi:hypothetical protein